jgi:hypothetical protein
MVICVFTTWDALKTVPADLELASAALTPVASITAAGFAALLVIAI